MMKKSNRLMLCAVLAAGTLFGVGAMCCFFIAGKEDEELEKLNKEQEADTE